MDYRQDYLSNTMDLQKELQTIMDKHDIDCDVKVVNFGNCIEVRNYEGTEIWIRVTFVKNGLDLDFNVVQIEEDYRRNGIFTEIVNMVKTKNFVHKAFISNVCTEEMINFCKKHKFTFEKSINAFVICKR